MKKNKWLSFMLSFLTIIIFALLPGVRGMEAPLASLEYDAQAGEKPKNIAIIGAGVAGIVQAIAFLEKFGDEVDIHMFEKDDGFNLSKGVELIAGPAFQIVMQALGQDMTPELQQYGYLTLAHKVVDNRGNPLLAVEEIIQNSQGMYAGIASGSGSGATHKIPPYWVNRGVFMKLLQDRLLLATQGKDIIHWGHQLDRVTSEQTKKTLHFKNGQIFENVDLLVGADGIRSKVRALLFDDHKAAHVGANIIYGTIPGQTKIITENKFNIICSQYFTTVSCCYKNFDETLTTWWAIVYPDEGKPGNQEEVRAFWESQANVRALAHALVNKEDGDTYSKQLVDQTTEFKYAGFFLERDPLTLQRWGIDNAVLIGDAIHGIQPWAGVGASLAAEDGYVLAVLVKQYGFDQLPLAFEAFQRDRTNRILYFRQLTRNNTPQGILPADLRRPIEDVVREYGDQRPLAACPAWQEMLDKRIAKDPQASEQSEEKDLTNQ
ncbi:MAG: putative Monooxygenase FAD-binding [Alphaproteobacteria bacterium]|jgi:6-hydroxynicotinate 3-monooxygenase|nr:putative Monooxygenase FAD-binding [Alphaproteobacteria bacterium]